ncbi:GTPase-associated protein 1-related protein [Spirillospora sp. NBC_01491]|uniref:GTPase-associated protein 1-related protein n=1 Tax=Spirillospora sp. NBC_01491 TaxID=2976007 RepID=UPI002E309628|nr:GTPase-associated protein 1-related protein [Spirillospora sp. NBC_01491]
MDFQQLYYTSCRTGLSGFAGYQFNAVTPGVTPEVMNDVEALSSYEPPGTLGHSPTPAQIADCPVNLCFAPGPVPIVANVAFTGTDYSGRFGNYFAHALVGAGGAGWQGPPPIELWRAGLWTRETVAGPDLPPVRGALAPGPLRRETVDAFLDGAAGRARLPALLAAAERAVLDEERSVVILAAGADETARWIAALSYLLPPPLVARMSFATYQFRPSYSRHHVIGTVPGAEIVADERAFEGFFLFDFTAGAAGAASEVDAGPMAHLLAGAGTVAAGALWRRAAPLAAGGEVRLADWHAPVVAAALLDGGVGVNPDDLDVVCAWLAGQTPRLGRDLVGRIGAAALGHEAASAAHLTGLADAAAAGGLGELLELAEERLVTAQLAAESGQAGRPADGRADGRADGPAGGGVGEAAALRSPKAREFAARRYTQLLADADSGTVARLLRLAQAHDVQPDERVLQNCGARVIGPQLLRAPSDAELHAVVRRWPALRSGTLAHLDQAAAADLRRLVAVFDAGFGDAVPAAELKAVPALRAAGLVAAARRDPARRVDAAVTVLAGRGPAGRLDGDLLTALWPDGWSTGDATALLPRLPDGASRDPALVPWVVPLLRAPLAPDDRPKLDAYGAFCDVLNALPLAGLMPSDLQNRLKAMDRIRRIERNIVTVGEPRHDPARRTAGEALLNAYGTPATAAAKDYLRLRLAVLLPALPHDALAALLGRAPAEIRTLHLDRLGARLEGDRAVAVVAAAAGFATLCSAAAGGQRAVAEGIEGVLLHHLPDWRKRDLNGVEREVRRRAGAVAEEFKHWRHRHCRRRPRWLPGRAPHD